MSWIKLPRTLMKSPVFQEPRLLKVWLWCRLKAAYRPTVVNLTVAHKTVAVELASGEFIFGRHKAAQELNIPVTTLGRDLAKLQTMGCISIDAYQRFSILRLKLDKTDVVARPKVPDEMKQKLTGNSITRLSNEELSDAMGIIRKDNLPDIMSQLAIFSDPDIILSSYQSHLQQRPVMFASVAQVKAHLHQYLLQEWV